MKKRHFSCFEHQAFEENNCMSMCICNTWQKDSIIDLRDICYGNGTFELAFQSICLDRKRKKRASRFNCSSNYSITIIITTTMIISHINQCAYHGPSNKDEWVQASLRLSCWDLEKCRISTKLVKPPSKLVEIIVSIYLNLHILKFSILKQVII